MGDEMVSNMISIFHWKSHYSTFCNKLSTFWEKEQYTDVTLACQGKYFQVHKLVLSTCSDYFEDILKNTPCKHPVIVLNEIKPDDLEVLLRFMYEGVIRVPQNYLQRLMKVASLLLIKGLGVRDDKSSEPKNKKDRSSNDEQLSPPSKRKKSEDNIQATIPPHFQPKPIKSNLYTDTQHPDSAVEKKSTVKVITDGSIVKEDIEEISDNSLADDDDDDFQCRSENEDDQHMEPLNNGSAAEDLAGPSGLQRDTMTNSLSRKKRLENSKIKHELLINFLKYGEPALVGLSKDRKRTVRRQEQHYVLDKDKQELFYVGPCEREGKKKKVNAKQRVITDEDKVISLLHHFHSSNMGGHSGINNTMFRLRQYYTWPGMKADVEEYVKTCFECQTNDDIKTTAPEMIPIKVEEP